MENKVKEITSRQREALEFIKEFITKKGISPTLSGIGKGISLSSKSTTHGILKRLQEKGYIAYEPKSPRSIRVTDQLDEVTFLRRRVAELEAQLLKTRPDIATMKKHDGMLSAVIAESRRAVGD